MPSTRGRKQARFRKRLKIELADGFNRRKKRIDDAITATALRISFAKEDGAVLVPHTIERWNEAAEGMEATHGKNWFPIRLAHENAFTARFIDNEGHAVDPTPFYGRLSNRLDYMAVLKDDPVYAWMADLLFMACIVPEDRIKFEAGPRNGAWDRRLRKTKANIALAGHKALADALDEQKQDREENETRKFWRDHDRAEAQLDAAVRSDRSYSRTLPVKLTKDEN
jgi:hypothetical protein